MIFKNKEKGVSLIIIFFILTIILSVVLNISILLYSRVKVIRNIGNSVVAFYAADSGVEKILFYDRKQIPTGGKRGLCYMSDLTNLNACPSSCTPALGDCVESHCYDPIYTELSPDGCNILTCENCFLSFSSFFDNKSYDAEISVTKSGTLFTANIDSKGNFGNVARKIQTKVESRDTTSPQAPEVTNACFYSNPISGGVEVEVYADISDPDGVASAYAYIQSPDEVNIDPLVILDNVGNNYFGIWDGNPPGTVYVDIEACDTINNCVVVDNLDLCP